LNQRWSESKRQYKSWYQSKKGFKLGKVQFVKVEDDLVVCNMIGQKDIKTVGNVPPIRYGAIAKCLDAVMIAAKKKRCYSTCAQIRFCFGWR